MLIAELLELNQVTVYGGTPPSTFKVKLPLQLGDIPVLETFVAKAVNVVVLVELKIYERTPIHLPPKCPTK